MRKHIRKAKRPVRTLRRRLTATIVMATVILAIGAVTALSRQADRKSQSATKAEIAKARLASQGVHLDEQTGQPHQLTDEEARKLAGGLKELVNQSAEGLAEVQHADGSVSLDLEDRFQNVTVARVNKDGSVSQSCVDNPKAAGAFFGIDPRLIDNTSESGTSKPARTDSAKTRN